MLKTCGIKFKVLFIICVFLLWTDTLAFGMEFNDDIQKITLDYYYYDGFGRTKLFKVLWMESGIF
jgi:hypothetical protein